MNSFELSTEQLKQVMETLRERIAHGLEVEDGEIKCLATYLGVPDGNQSGRALVIDTGGTNMRAAIVSLEPGNGQIESGPISDKVPDGRTGEAVEAVQFFEAQAKLTDGLEFDKEALPLGYCFSYPAMSLSDGDALLLRWTKGINVKDAVNNPVGRPLKEALQRHGVETEGLSVLNDTVASLLGGAHLYASPRFGNNYIGLILGTGTNMAGVFSPQQLGKVQVDYPMVVNLESGNFIPPFLTKYDDQVDAESLTPGIQRFEKAVSGHYLPLIFDKVCPGIIDPEEGSGKLVELRDSQEGEASQVAGALLKRSARLAAAGVAALAGFYPADRDTAVLGEGSLLWGDPQYAETFESTLDELAPERNIDLVRQRNNVNLLGAASAALSRITLEATKGS